MTTQDLHHAIEAVIFAAGQPLTLADIKKIFERSLDADEVPAEAKTDRMAAVVAAYRELETAAAGPAGDRGFVLARVAEGLTFRSNPRHAILLRAMREERPVRLSQAALETLAIVAYRQPVTKPDVDHIRGVDCGATLRLLLERNLVRIVGKKEEPGRPMLYGTTKEFLSFFNLGSLSQLPSLHEFHELSTDSQEELAGFDAQQPSLGELSEHAKKLQLGDEPAVSALDEAVAQLAMTEDTTRAALGAQGIQIDANSEAAATAPVAVEPSEA
jgi:segregation and condensation protein B